MKKIVQEIVKLMIKDRVEAATSRRESEWFALKTLEAELQACGLHVSIDKVGQQYLVGLDPDQLK